MSDKLIEAIEHYQRNLNRGLKDDNTTKLLHCIFKLSNLPITVGHLEETGVGRTVNAMRKMEGKVGDASRELVNKWKLMVSQNQDCDDTNKNEPNGKSDSSHRQSDKSKNRSDNSDSESENSSSEEKSSESENDEEDENDSDGYEDVKRHKSESPPREKHKSHHHHKKSSKDNKNKSRSHPNKDYERKEKEYKYKRDKSPSRSPEKIKSNKEKDRSKSNSSNKRKNEEENERSHSKKHKSHHKEDENVNETKRIKDKSRIESKHKESNQSYSQSSNQSSHSSNQSSHSVLKEVKKESKRDSYDKKSKSKEKDEKNDEKKDEKKYSDKIKKEPKSNRNENGICSESGTSFADALGMLEPSTSRTTVVTNSNKKSKPERSIREKTPEKSYRKESYDKEDKKEKKKERDRDRESSKQEKSKERDKKVSTSSSKIDLVIPPPPPKNDLDINISSLLPMITPNYRPLANPLYDNMQNLGRGKALNDDEALSLVMSQKNQRTKVYSGNKMFFNSIPSLFELCIRVLQDNIDALEYTGGVPYVILKPVLDKASPQQLYTMEHYNPYLIEDTDELWQFHCSKDFKNKRREELESWREMYMRCLDEREAKLKALTENIKVAQEKSTPVRQTKLAYIDSFVKPPRDVIRKQAKNGIDKKPLITPQSRLNAIAAGNSSAQVSVPNPVRASSNNSSGAVKPKKAPLMQKTLAFLKGGRFRR